jgi:predicted RNA-binding Zn-ribbon protein involved in translation (DUF1610 family)
MNTANGFAVTKTKSCKNCGQTFVPNWRARVFCCPSCREAYYLKRAQLRFRYLRMQTRLRLQQDPEFRSVWMSRINELRAKEGRPPYWNAYENRPYTKDEVALLIRPATDFFRARQSVSSARRVSVAQRNPSCFASQRTTEQSKRPSLFDLPNRACSGENTRSKSHSNPTLVVPTKTGEQVTSVGEMNLHKFALTAVQFTWSTKVFGVTFPMRRDGLIGELVNW